MNGEVISAVLQLVGIILMVGIFIGVYKYENKKFKKELLQFNYDFELNKVERVDVVYFGVHPKYIAYKKRVSNCSLAFTKSRLTIIPDSLKTDAPSLEVAIKDMWLRKPGASKLRVHFEPTGREINTLKFDFSYVSTYKPRGDNRSKMISYKLYEFLIKNGAHSF